MTNDPAEDDLYSDRTEVEARSWLTDHPDGFASDRFATAGEAMSFVNALYAAGASQVTAWMRPDEQEPSLMYLALPDDSGARAHLFAIVQAEEYEHGEDFSVDPSGRQQTQVTAEMARDMGDADLEGDWLEEEGPLRDIGQQGLRLWWD